MAKAGFFGTIVLVGIGVGTYYALTKCKSCPDTFTGERREIAKTNIAGGKTTKTTIPLLYRWFPDEETMRIDYEVSHSSPRSSIENQNVTVVCWLYTYSYQDDGDFHLIIGSSPNRNNAWFFSAEVSGLPRSSSRNYKYHDRLEKARDQFLEVIDDCPSCSPGRYVQSFFDKPLKVEVTGSLYWDTEHTGGRCCSGTTRQKDKFVYKSETPWEIHPVTDIHKVDK